MDDSVPRSVEGGVLAIADKADSIAGMFALGLQPTGSKDPFALRRAANGIVKIIAEHKLPLPISKLFADARAEYAGSEAERRFDPKVNFEESVANFMYERLEFYLRDVRGFAYDVVKAVLAAGSDDVVDAIARAEAVSEVRGSEDFASISVAFKRMKNILRQARETNKTSAERLRSLGTYRRFGGNELAAKIPRYGRGGPSASRGKELCRRRWRRSAACADRSVRLLRQSDGDGGRRALTRQSSGAAARFVERILDHRRL